MDLSFISIPFMLDMLPVGLACYALIRLQQVKQATAVIYLAKASSILLIICQFTWIHSYLNGFQLVTSFIDSLWSVFNSVVMILVLLVAEKEVQQGNCNHPDCNKTDKVG